MPSKVFIPKTTKAKNSPNIMSIMGTKNTVGDIGIEIEVEGTHLLSPDETPSPWKWTEDHSLRGEHAEYILNKPVTFDKVPNALAALWKAFKAKHTVIADSNRTSIHIHVNVQQWYLNRLTAFMALYFIMEEILTEWCGEHRVGNLFCLRAKDAEAIVSYIKNFIQSDGQSPIQEFLHYAGMNANALKKFGSLEIRTLRGCSDPTVILDWVEILERLYHLSEDYPDPRTICTSVSSVGPIAFFENIIGPKLSVVRNGISMTDNEISQSITNGVRLAQDLCYCRDWDIFNPIKIKPDVFKRNQKNIISKLMNNPPVLPNEDVDSAMLDALNNNGWLQNSQGGGGSLEHVLWASPVTEEEDYPEPDPDYLDEGN